MTKKSCTVFLLLVFCLLSVNLISESAQSQNTCSVGREQTVAPSTSVAVTVTATLEEDVCAFVVPLKFRRGDDQDGFFTLDSIRMGGWAEVDSTTPFMVQDSINNVANFMWVGVLWLMNNLPAETYTLFTMYFTTSEFWEEAKGVKIDTTTIPFGDAGAVNQFVFLDCTLGEAETLQVTFAYGSLGPTWIREVESEGAQLPQEFALGQNYPNPFNPTTVIRFALPEDGHVKIDVFNVLGQRVTTLVDQYLTAGYKETGWDGKDSKGAVVGSGIYFYRIWTERFTEVKKMILLK